MEESTQVEITPASVALKRCPFCGGKPSLRKGQKYKNDPPSGMASWEWRAGDWVWKPGIRCTSCQINREFESVEAAIEWWNTRKDKR